MDIRNDVRNCFNKVSVKISKLIRNLLFLLIALYFSQGFLYAQGSVISQSALAFLLVISGIYLVKCLLLKGKKELFFKVWTAFLLLNTLGFFLTGSISNGYHFGMFKGILISSLIFYPFYYFSKNNQLETKHLIQFFILILPIAIAQFFFNRDQILIERVTSNEDVVNNMAYFFVGLMPFVFLFIKRRMISLLSMLVLVFFVIEGAKRGAILTGAFVLLMYAYAFMQSIQKRNKYKGYLISFIGLGLLSYYVYSLYTSNEYLMTRMSLLSEGGYSGRDVIYSSIFNIWQASPNPLNIFFGFGFASSLELTGGSFAHNDWLELLSNFGLLGIGLYLSLFISAFILLKNNNWNKDKKILFFTVISIWFLVTLFSMGYTSTNGFLREILLGYVVGGYIKNIS